MLRLFGGGDRCRRGGDRGAARALPRSGRPAGRGGRPRPPRDPRAVLAVGRGLLAAPRSRPLRPIRPAYDGSARRNCWSTTPTRRPPCSRRRSCNGTGSKRCTRGRPVQPDPRTADRAWDELRQAARDGPGVISPVARRARGLHDRRLPARHRACRPAWRPRYLDIDDIGWNGRRTIHRPDGTADPRLFKLYPWEWMVREEFGPHLPAGPTRWYRAAVEDAASNKAILPVLWEMFSGHPNLLPAFSSAMASASKSPCMAARAGTWRSLRAGHTAARTAMGD